MNEVPTKPGFYWAKWRICDDGTYETEAEFSPSSEWEPVRLTTNHIDPQHPEHFKVEVGGVAMWQSPENFVWGDMIPFVTPASKDKALLRFLLKNQHECIGDHPAWVKQIEAAIGATS